MSRWNHAPTTRKKTGGASRLHRGGFRVRPGAEEQYQRDKKSLVYPAAADWRRPAFLMGPTIAAQ